MLKENPTRLWGSISLLGLLLGLAAWVSFGPEIDRVDADTPIPSVRGTPDFPIKNPIDAYILTKLNEAKIKPSETCSDEEYLRRVYLDIIGVIPSSSAVKSFLADKSTDKREKVVDKLLTDERYGMHWAVMWGDLLREHSQGKRQEGTYRGSYKEWLKDQLNENVPYDTFFTNLVCSVGNAEEDGAVNFYLRDEQDRVETVNEVADVFMGTRMACAQCHDHPFDKWEQKDFHSLMAFFTRVQVVPDQYATILRLKETNNIPADILAVVKPKLDEAELQLKALHDKETATKDAAPDATAMGMQPMEMGKRAIKGIQELTAEVEKALGKQKAERFRQIVQGANVRRVQERPNGDYHMPADGDGKDKKKAGGELVPAVFPWNPDLKSESKTRRADLAKYVTGSRQFAAVQANRLFGRLMGRGITEPTDDFREKNPPTNPDLLNYLTDEFLKAKMDNKALIKLIVSSSAYQRSSKPNNSNEKDDTLYSHFPLRRMTAEQVFDSILVATGRADGLKDLGKGGATAMDIASAKKGGGKGPGAGGGVEWAFDLETPSRTGSFMNIFNQPDRNSIVVKRETNGSITQALELLNGRSINDQVQAKAGALVRKLVDQGFSPEDTVRELYLAALSRLPTDTEMSRLRMFLKGKTADNIEPLEDLNWALLNSREFVFIK